MACTTFLVGKKASLDGSTLIARNEDGGDKPNPQRFVVINPENQPKRYRSIATACEFDLPDNPLSYTSTPDADSSYGIWAAAGINSENVAMTATETSTTNSRILGLDPYVEKGLGEEDFTTITLPYIHSAREGVERVGQLLEKYGTIERLTRKVFILGEKTHSIFIFLSPLLRNGLSTIDTNNSIPKIAKELDNGKLEDIPPTTKIDSGLIDNDINLNVAKTLPRNSFGVFNWIIAAFIVETITFDSPKKIADRINKNNLLPSKLYIPTTPKPKPIIIKILFLNFLLKWEIKTTPKNELIVENSINKEK